MIDTEKMEQSAENGVLGVEIPYSPTMVTAVTVVGVVTPSGTNGNARPRY